MQLRMFCGEGRSERQTTVANNLAAFNSQAWSKRIIHNLDQVNVMLALVNKDYEGELQNIGDTVQVRTLGSISLASYAKNQTITYQDLAPVREAMVIADAQSFAFKVDDLEKAQNDINAMDAYTTRAAVALNNVIEAKLLSFYPQALVANQITGAAAANIALSSTLTDGTSVYDNLVLARTKLTQQNVPMTGRWVVVDPATTALLLKDTVHFIRATDLGDNVVTNGSSAFGGNRPGYIGRIAGFDVYESNQVPVVSGAKYIQYGTPMAISYAAQLREMEAIRLETTFATAVRGLLLHDGKVFAEASKAFGYIKATP